MYNSDNTTWTNEQIFPKALRYPSGFEKSESQQPPTDSVVTYDPSTRTVSIAPTGDSFF